jgi:hypothetical protein
MRTPAGFSVVRITSIDPFPGRSPDCALGFFLAWSFREFIFSALGHIGQTVNARGFVYATCCALHTLVAHQAKGRGIGIDYCWRTADKTADTNIGSFLFLRVLQAKKGADERTRTADLLITSVRSWVAEHCRRLQIPHRQRVLCSLPCLGLQGIASGLGSN